MSIDSLLIILKGGNHPSTDEGINETCYSQSMKNCFSRKKEGTDTLEGIDKPLKHIHEIDSHTRPCQEDSVDMKDPSGKMEREREGETEL